MFNVDPAFLLYSDGIYACGAPSTITHALLVMGFGAEEGVDYWLVQNSWGTSWGQGGFAKIRRGSCSLAACASFPVGVIDPARETRRQFQLVLHDPVKTGARCLDGTPAGLYYSKGYGSGANKTIIHF